MIELAPGVLLPRSAESRLWSQVEKSPGCWVWTGYLRNGQHGAMSINDREIYVHRLSYAIHHGPIPQGKVVCHRCDNPPCVQPDHLFLGDQQDNVSDMRAKGRGKNPPRHAGEVHPAASLTDAQVTEIRERWARGGVRQRDLAEGYGVSQSTIWRLINRVVRA